MALLRIRAQPKASRDEIGDWLDDGTLRVRVTAPPEGGKANAAVVRLLAKLLKVAPSSITIVLGQTSRIKTLELSDLSEDEIRQRLAKTRQR